MHLQSSKNSCNWTYVLCFTQLCQVNNQSLPRAYNTVHLLKKIMHSNSGLHTCSEDDLCLTRRTVEHHIAVHHAIFFSNPRLSLHCINQSSPRQIYQKKRQSKRGWISSFSATWPWSQVSASSLFSSTVQMQPESSLRRCHCSDAKTNALFKCTNPRQICISAFL